MCHAMSSLVYLRWRMNEGQDKVARALNGNNQYEAFGRLVPEGKRFACILTRDPVDRSQMRSGCCSITRPRSWASLYGLSMATTDSPTRASRFVFLALSEPVPEQTIIVSPSRSIHTGSTCGAPSRISVAR